jgi:hypothetical protein
MVCQSDWLPMMMAIGVACSVVKANSLRKPVDYRLWLERCNQASELTR